MKKTKVYIVTEARRGANYGVGTYIEQLIVCLRTLRFEVVLLRLFVPQKAEMTQEIRDDGLMQIDIPFIFAYDKIHIERHFGNIAFLLKDIQSPDEQSVFHLNFMLNATLVAAFQHVLGAKVILTFHFSEWSFLLSGNYDRLQDILQKSDDQRTDFENRIYQSISQTKATLNQCDRVICVARHSRETLKRLYGIADDKLTVIANAVQDIDEISSEPVRQQIRKRYRIKPESRIILFAGRLDEVKGISPLIEACKKVFDVYPQAHLFLVGEGDLCCWQESTSGYWMNISFTGKLNREQLYDLYRIADVGVCPSLHEEFGLVAIEMMMHQCPLIVSDTTGLAESVEDRISGLKVPVLQTSENRTIDSDSLAEKICLLLENPALAQQLAEQGRMRYERFYSMPVFQYRIQETYNQMLNPQKVCL